LNNFWDSDLLKTNSPKGRGKSNHYPEK